MFLIKHFLGNKYERVNKIIDSFNETGKDYINMEACCSLPFQSVLEAQKSPIYLLPTEGNIGKRYFPNMQSIEEIDKYSEEIILKLFNLKNTQYGVNIQPHSGTQANQIVYNAILKNNDTVLSLDPKSGGHISHNKFCKTIHVVNFGLKNDTEIDYDEIEQLTIKYSPKLIIIGASSFCNNINYQSIINIAHKYNALVLADLCHTVLYVLGNKFTSPFPNVDFVTFTMDKTLRGPQGGILIYNKKYEQKINYSVFPLTQGGPLQSIQFAKLLACVELSNINIMEYATSVQENAKTMNDIFKQNNIQTFCSDSKTHIILLNTKQFNLTGEETESLLFQNHILANKNLIPGDQNSPEVTSGIRLGTTVLTNLNYTKEDIIDLTDYISIIFKNKIVSKKYLQFIEKYNKF